jgi:SPP1 gp7 family putative phage head morphogenesis protein
MRKRDDLDLLSEKSGRVFADLLTDIGVSSIYKDREGENKATKKLGEILRRTAGVADLLGRKRTLQQVFSEKSSHFADPITAGNFTLQMVYGLPFRQAADAILQGEVFQSLPQRKLTALEVEINKLFGEQAPLQIVLGLMNTKKLAIRKANEILHKSLIWGTPPEKAKDEIKKAMGYWSTATGDTIYRTQMSKAYSAGQWRQMEDPAVRNRVGAIKFEATPDSDVRPQHLAWNGYFADSRDPIWDWMTPPIHYNCRCALLLIPASAVKALGKPPKRPPLPKPSFGYRPNKQTYSFYGAAL